MGAKISKRYLSHNFDPISPKLYDKYDCHVGIQAVTFLAICQKIKILFGTRGTTMHICRVFLMPDSFILVWGHSVHFAKFPILRLHYSFNSLHQISTKLHTTYHDQGLI